MASLQMASILIASPRLLQVVACRRGYGPTSVAASHGQAMSFAKLDELGHKLEALEHALSILGADEATHMAVGGGEKRAEAMASLAGMHAPPGDRARDRRLDRGGRGRGAERGPAGGAARIPASLHQPDLPAVRIRRAPDDGPHALRAALARPARQERLGGLPAGARGRRRAGARGGGDARRRARARSLRRADGAVRSRQPRRRHHAGLRRAEELPQGLRAGGARRAGGAAGEVAAQAAVRHLSRSRGSASSASP